jgi:hypothetical protein
MLPKFRGLTALTGLRVAFPGGILSHLDRTGGLVEKDDHGNVGGIRVGIGRAGSSADFYHH